MNILSSLLKNIIVVNKKKRNENIKVKGVLLFNNVPFKYL